MEGKYRLLHILPDEKVVDTFVSMMEEVYPGESLYAIYGKGLSPSRVRSTQNVVFFQRESREFIVFLKNTSSFSRVVIHFVSSDRAFRFLHHPDITGLFWGGDLYDGLLAAKGFNLYYEIENVWKIRAAGRIPVPLYRILVFVRDRINYSRELSLIRRFKRVGMQECDAKVFMHYFPDLTFDRVPSFSYYPIEQLIGPEYWGRQCNGDRIWVNNSAALGGNHYSVFRRLSSFSPDIQVIAPISYGERQWAQYVERVGYELLGTRFVPLKTFLPVQEYYALFLSVNSFVFGHLRQCGYGNIIVALFFGAKCFFYKENPLFEELIENGFTVFSIEDDLKEDFAVTPLPEPFRIRNRNLVLSFNSREVLLKKYKESFV